LHRYLVNPVNGKAVTTVFLSINKKDRRENGMEKSNVYSYAREQAIKDGVLVDITMMAKRAGFSCPIAVTSSVWRLAVRSFGMNGQSIHGRLWDLLMALKTAVNHPASGGDRIRFPMIFDNRPVEEYRVERLWAMIQMGDDSKPTIMIMREGEVGDHDFAEIKGGFMSPSGHSH
jgi:hypothetical protein